MIDETRVPPQDLFAEQSVLGSVFLDDDALDRALEVMTADDFYRETHRDMFLAMLDLAAGKRAIDAVTLTDALRARGRLEAIGGPAYIAELVGCVPSALNVRHYAAIVHDKAMLRGLGALGHTLIEASYDAPGEWSTAYTEETIANAEYALTQVANSATRKPEKSAKELLSEALYRLEHRVAVGIPTGFARIDQSFAGFAPGHVTVAGARTSRGKTALATQIAINAAKAGYAVVYVTLEMEPGEMLLRALGTEARVDMFAIQQRGYRGDEQKRVEAARQVLEPLPLRFIYRSGMRPRDLRLECKRLMREIGELKFAVIDYVNLMRGDQHHRERWLEMRDVVLRLKEIAGELSIPLLVLSQLNREVGEHEKPSLGHLRDTGAAEEHSSNVLFLWEPAPPKTEGDKPLRVAFDEWADCKLTIAKQRNGPAQIDINMQFRKSWGKFEAI